MGTLTTDVAGLLLVDKPASMTSHDVVSIVRRGVHTRRVGHAGTLDPFATGLLVLLVGRGTRLMPFIDGEPKVYDATIVFGAETDTDDATGEITREAPPPVAGAIDDGIARLTGEIMQVPPAYSAKQVGGTRAYAAARRGKQLDLAPARVTIHEWKTLARDTSTLSVRITCSGGTYIRALARDLGRLSESAAHLSQLRRIKSGAFDVSDAATIDAVKTGTFDLQPLRGAIPGLATRELTESELARVLHGNPIAVAESPSRRAAESPGRPIALIDENGDLVAVAERSGTELRPKVVLRDPG
ncbi:MAG TPA: tRNA pseudouridine(55) synthase TruB [Gemmatimonadaceae bacterium]|nr:tRNA pseudouridine(55) synthase TruB [Gemmatimonadaceae bacterium]